MLVCHTHFVHGIRDFQLVNPEGFKMQRVSGRLIGVSPVKAHEKFTRWYINHHRAINGAGPGNDSAGHEIERHRGVGGRGGYGGVGGRGAGKGYDGRYGSIGHAWNRSD